MNKEPPALTRDGTHGRVYGGDLGLIHVPDGFRRMVGLEVALDLDRTMRRHSDERYTDVQRHTLPLCPGCYMIVLFNAAIALAKRSGQPLHELGFSLAHAFSELGWDGVGANGLEDIEIRGQP